MFTNRKGFVDKQRRMTALRGLAERAAVRIGAGAEERVLSILTEDDDPAEWIRFCRKATRDEDAQGIDLVVMTDVGELYVQVKSSRGGLESFRSHRQQENVLPIVAVIAKASDHDADLRVRLMRHLGQYRKEIRAAGSRAAWIQRQREMPPEERTALRTADDLSLNVARLLAILSVERRPTWMLHCRVAGPQDPEGTHLAVITSELRTIPLRVAGRREQFEEFKREDARADLSHYTVLVSDERTDAQIRKDCIMRLGAHHRRSLTDPDRPARHSSLAQIVSIPDGAPVPDPT